MDVGSREISRKHLSWLQLDARHWRFVGCRSHVLRVGGLVQSMQERNEMKAEVLSNHLRNFSKLTCRHNLLIAILRFGMTAVGKKKFF